MVELDVLVELEALVEFEALVELEAWIDLDALVDLEVSVLFDALALCAQSRASWPCFSSPKPAAGYRASLVGDQEPPLQQLRTKLTDSEDHRKLVRASPRVA